eukprot:6210400-Pleurochrysis_carterae.AAC.1
MQSVERVELLGDGGGVHRRRRRCKRRIAVGCDRVATRRLLVPARVTLSWESDFVVELSTHGTRKTRRQSEHAARASLCSCTLVGAAKTTAVANGAVPRISLLGRLRHSTVQAGCAAAQRSAAQRNYPCMAAAARNDGRRECAVSERMYPADNVDVMLAEY